MKMMKKLSVIIFMVMMCSVFVMAETCGTGSTSGMISYWTFDDSNTIARDYVGSNHGTCSGNTCPVWTSNSNVSAGALSFDGTSQYISMSTNVRNSFNITNQMTEEAWVQANGGTVPHQMIFSLNNYYSSTLGFDRTSFTGGLYLDSGSFGLSTSPITQGQWYHLVSTYNGSVFKLYLNGVEVGSVYASGNVRDGDNAAIGTHMFNPPQYLFKGLIDDLAVYNRALTADEVYAHFQSGSVSHLGYCTSAKQQNETVPEVNNTWILQALLIIVIAVIAGIVLFKKK